MSAGRARSHESADGHVTGRALYTDDQLRPFGMLSAHPVCAPLAHGRIVHLDVAPALRVPGVAGTLTAADVPGENDSSDHRGDEVLLPDGEVFYRGQPVAWVLAETAEAARLGALKVALELEPLPPILSIEEAVAAGSFHGPPQAIRRGDVEGAFAASEFRLDGEIFIGGQDHFYLETQASWAVPGPDGGMQVFASTQHPSETQAVVARVLGIPRNRVVVTCLRMGGGFGGKESQASPWAAVAALAARKTGRPVRVRLRRDEDMNLTGKRHPFLGRYRAGYDGRGRLQALSVELVSDGGWSSDLSEAVMARALFHADNAYFVPAFEVVGRVAKTHKTSQTAFRGFGGPQGMLVVEEVLDRVARSLRLPPETVRERNFYRGAGETNTTHYGQVIEDNRTLRVWSEVRAAASFEARRAALRSWNRASRHSKRGLAVTPVKFGISFTHTPLNQAGALVLVYGDGSVQLNHGGTEMGQGLHTKMLQVAARTLGLDPGRLRMMPTATDKVPNTSATAASSGSDLNGQAVRDACETLLARLAAVAAPLLGCDPSEVAFRDGWVLAGPRPKRRLSWDEVVERAHLERVSLAATGFYRTPGIHYDAAAGRGRPFHYFAYGAAVSEVEVDGFTGAFRLRRVDIVHDAGDSLNPLVDRGQIEGGFVQGLGWLTCEELVWDAEGRLLTHAPSTYKIPTIREVPEDFEIRLLERAAQPGVIYGSKAVGEPPLMLALSVREAIRDAVAAFGDERAGAVPLASPATPEAILRAITAVRLAGAEELKPLVSGD